MAVREIDELYDVYLDVRQRWDTKVGCHIRVTIAALGLIHPAQYSEPDNLKTVDTKPQILSISLMYVH